MSTPDPIPAESPDPAVLRAEQRLRALQELTEIGMDFARALQRKTKTEEDLAGPAESFARVSRAVRLTISLEAKTDQALRDLQAGVAREAEARRAETVRRAAEAETARRAARRDSVRDLVIEAAEREISDVEALCALEDALNERLEDDLAYEDLEGPPLREIVGRLCADLELAPDWRRWTGEGWARRPPFERPQDSPFVCPGRTRVYDDDGELIPRLSRESEPARLE